jgi:hypothetical protein
MLKKTIILLWGVMLFLAASGWSQRILFKFQDGSTASYSIAEVRKLTHKEDTLQLKKTDGTVIDWKINTIANFRYDGTTNIQEVVLNTAEVKIFPNPFRGAVRIRYELLQAEKVAVDIFDMQGRNIRSWPLSQQAAGTHEVIWNSNDAGGKAVPSGTYICRITTNKGTFSKMMVLE